MTMTPFTVHRGTAAALPRVNVDTDQIIPKQFLKRVERTGFGPALFFDWRYQADGSPNPGFELNQPKAAGASILLAGPNFGCGSSREHAVWALREFGFRAIVAPSFGVIFQNNCVRNGLLPLTLDQALIERLAQQAGDGPFTIDLTRCVLCTPAGTEHAFEIDALQREMLLEGLDPVALTLRLDDRIRDFQARDRLERPWIYLSPLEPAGSEGR